MQSHSLSPQYYISQWPYFLTQRSKAEISHRPTYYDTVF